MYKASSHIKVTQIFSESIDNLNLSKRRSILALLGIIVGSSSIIALLTIGGNAADEAVRIFKNMGTDILVVGFPYSHQNRQPLPLTLDSQALREAVPGISQIAPITLHSAQLSHNGQNTDASLVGTTQGLADAIGLQFNAGRDLSRYDHKETFAVVGARVAEDLGSLGNPLRVGDLIRIDNYLFNVIGIAESLPATPLIPIVLDESILIPIEGMRRLRPAPEITGIIIKADEADLPDLAKVLHNYLSKIFNGREVDIQIPQQLLDGLRHQASTFSYLLAALGGISLLVGGVGVMNVMLMSVTERKREIGIRMALGARQRDIRTLFLLEAVNLSIVGAVVGAVLGVAIAFSFTHFSGWEFTLSIIALPLGVGCSLLTGIFFGLYPAISASKLQPAEALRAE
ncbi:MULTISPECIES: ABC transporter permease [unclassified Halomonas]|uniref:ABC transporter permease n=1 Tax=unclassified Halomonas TaxID=2609666 RepID=UPI0007D9B74F|nr:MULTISPECIES: ABC transporter permease [unclassified Halomonas]MBT2788947.1 ABC transporter permease [Halomonas sp. ISL-106]MBT2799124.1 ABC transporter permease [Halomonas sp. ISL-104]OAL60239.1 ABC transporter permease [Halomonas sp. ALS9]